MTTPILAIDTSALMRRYIPDPHAGLVLEAMAGADVWCASELARTEVLMALHRMAMAPFQHEELWRSARADWDAFHVVPVDGRCLSHAADLGATYGLRLTDAIHLAAPGTRADLYAARGLLSARAGDSASALADFALCDGQVDGLLAAEIEKWGRALEERA